jgi:hypothetical protein
VGRVLQQQEQGEHRNRGKWEVLLWVIWLPIFPLCLFLASQYAVWEPGSSTQTAGVPALDPDYSGDESIPRFKPLSPNIIVEIIADQILEASPIHPGEEELTAMVAARLENLPALVSPTPESNLEPELKPTDSSIPVTDGESTLTATDTPAPSSAGEATATMVGKRTPEATPTSTSEPTPTAAGTHMPTVTNTPKPSATDAPPTATATPTATSKSTSTSTPIPTDTPIPTATSTPTEAVGETVEIFMAKYNLSNQTLVVKARTNLSGCNLTLVGFGPMILEEGEHWVYTQENLPQAEAPSEVTVVSSCGGSDTSLVTRN